MNGSVGRAVKGLCLAAAIAVVAPAAASAQSDVWDPVGGSLPASRGGVAAEVRRTATGRSRSTRRRSAPGSTPRRRSACAPRSPAADAITLTLPAPGGGFQRFEVQESPIMEPGLAARHPEIKTYAGRGIDDPTATIRADNDPARLPRLGALAAGRVVHRPLLPPRRQRLRQLLRARPRRRPARRPFVEREDVARPDGPARTSARSTSRVGPEVTLRTYRLALVTDPTYATYFGGPANVTAAKVTLMNRVDQIYEDETGDPAGPDRRQRQAQPQHRRGHDASRTARAARRACFTPAQPRAARGGTLTRNRIVIGQIIGAGNYDIGHIMLGLNGGGVASLGVVGGNGKAQGCTGLPTPVGDFLAVDYVAHEMGHQFAGNHTFNGTQLNCSGGNRNAGTSVEPGSGSSIMAYAGICQQDNLQPHSDPYWSQRSYDEITTYVTSHAAADQRGPDRLAAGLRRHRLVHARATAARRPARSSAAPTTRRRHPAGAAGPSEVQTVALTGYDADGDSYTLNYKGNDTVPIVRGQNNTAAGIANALAGRQRAAAGDADRLQRRDQSFQVQIGGNNSGGARAGGLAVNNANVTAAVNAIPGFAGTVTAAGAGNSGFTLTFAGASASIDVPAVAIVDCTCTGATTVRENAKGGAPVPGWPAGGTVTVGAVTDAGYTLTFGGSHQGTDVDPLAVTNGTGGTTGAVTETTKGAPGILPPARPATVAGVRRRRRVRRHRLPGHVRRRPRGVDVDPLELVVAGAQRVRRRDRQGRPDREQGLHRRRDRQPRAGGHDRAGVHDPAADAVRPHGQRHRLGRRHRSPTCGSRTTAAAAPAPRSSTTTRPTARCSASSAPPPT